MRRPLIICAAAGALFLVVLLAYFSWYRQVALLTIQTQALANQITTRSRTGLRITAARTAIAGLAQTESTVENYFVAQADIVPFIEQLQSLGSAAGATVAVRSVSAGAGAVNPPLTIALTVSGTFDHVARAIGAIEYAPYDLIVSSLSLAEAKGVWQANVNIVVGSTGTVSTSASAAAAPLAPSGIPLAATSTTAATSTP